MSEKLRECIELLVQLANRKIDFNRYKEYSAGEDRTLLFIVKGGRGDYGFVVEGGKLRVMSELERPTVTVSCDEGTFWAIATNKMELDYAVATRRLVVTGPFWLRDYLILREIFTDVRKELGI